MFPRALMHPPVRSRGARLVASDAIPGGPGHMRRATSAAGSPAKAAGVAIVVLIELEQEKIYWMGP